MLFIVTGVGVKPVKGTVGEDFGLLSIKQIRSLNRNQTRIIKGAFREHMPFNYMSKKMGLSNDECLQSHCHFYFQLVLPENSLEN